MNNQNNSIFAWVAGVIVVALIVFGLWWLFQSPSTTTGDTATTTPQVATTTVETTPTPVATATEVRTSSTVDAIVASLTNATKFAALYSSTGVSASITGKGPYTVFVPTDSAFANLSPGTLSGMTAAQTKRLVQYHVVSGKILDLDAVSSGHYTALSKDMLNFNVQSQTKLAYVNSGYTITQYKASNGIVYVISAVLVPPQTPDATTGSTGTIVPKN